LKATTSRELSVDTVGVISTSSSRRRSRVGIPSICARPINVETPTLVSSTGANALSGSTVGIEPPSACIITVKFMIWPVETSKTGHFQSTNPFLVTFRLYPFAGTSEGASNVPSSVDIMLRRTPIDSFVSTTALSGIPSPFASRTVPVTAPYPATDCADTPVAHSTASRKRPNVVFMRSQTLEVRL
jgi:hypothetical protein